MTAQISDTLEWNGKRYSLCVLPLDLLFSKMESSPRFIPKSTANRRGYSAFWKIENKKLLLVSVRGEQDLSKQTFLTLLAKSKEEELLPPPGLIAASAKFRAGKDGYKHLIREIEQMDTDMRGHKVAPIDWFGSKIPEGNGFVPLSAAQSVNVENLLQGEVLKHAVWYSGLLRCSFGETLRYVHGGFHSECANELLIHIESGLVVSHWIVDNMPAFRQRERQKQVAKTCFSHIVTEMQRDTGKGFSRARLFNQPDVVPYSVEREIFSTLSATFSFGTVGDEADLAKRYEYDTAIHEVSRAASVAQAILWLKDLSKDNEKNTLESMMMYLSFYSRDLSQIAEVIDYLDPPSENIVEWANSNVKEMKRLIAEKKYALVGFSYALSNRE